MKCSRYFARGFSAGSWEHAYGPPSRDDPELAAQVIRFLKDLWEQA